MNLPCGFIVQQAVIAVFGIPPEKQRFPYAEAVIEAFEPQAQLLPADPPGVKRVKRGGELPVKIGFFQYCG